MKSTRTESTSRARAFTLVEMLIVITLIALLAALTMGGYTYAMNSTRRRLTTGTFETIKLGLERYFTEFSEYPQPNGSNLMANFPPGLVSYDMSGAACLYQALTGDGFDQIKGVTAAASSTGSGSGGGASSDGKIEGLAEIKNKMFADVPNTIFTRKGSIYILIDGFGHPFQYVKAVIDPNATAGGAPSANAPPPITVNSTYDLWSYSEDLTNTMRKSIDSLSNPKLSVKWIKNW
jgi:prepilin-type N-terminal cleavage/methylation domain-containing protein